MKRILQICALLLCQLAAIAQGEETKYTLTFQSDPKGYINVNYAVWDGDNYPHTSSYSDKHKPQIAAGQKVDLDVGSYNKYYKLSHLMYEGNVLPIVEETIFADNKSEGHLYTSFTMPDHDVTITAVLEYAPELPPNPNETGWDEQTGTIIANYFKPGDLRNTLYKLLYDKEKYAADYSKVKAITVIGEIIDYDWSIVYMSSDYKNLAYFDISRTTGLTEIKPYSTYYNAEDNNTLTTLLLPATITKIVGNDFYVGATLSVFKALRSLTCYATTPPTVIDGGLKGLPAELEVYVPAESLPLYAAAEGWKDLNLLPITSGIHSLTVSLPAGTDMQQYKDMYLELVNTQTGQTRRYVLTDRTQYTFTNLIEGTQYNIYIRNARDAILGSILAVDVEKDDVKVTFPDLKSLRDITLQLTAPDGTPVGEDAFTVTWTDAFGNYLQKGATLGGQVDGAKVMATVKLGERLGTQYQQPADTLITVGQETTITTHLSPLTTHQLSGSVTAAVTGLPIRGANIAVVQKLNGLYPLTLTTTSDSQGSYQLTAYDAPMEITVQATGYLPQKATITEHPTPNTQHPTPVSFALPDLTGTTINVDLSYRPAVREGEALVTADFSDYQNISYTVYDETNAKELTDIAVVQHPSIVLQGLDLQQGTKLRLTATSLTGQFMPTSTTCTVNADGQATASLPLTQMGQLIATFSQTDNQAVVGMLYDSEGKLEGNISYNNTLLTLYNIPDGQYTLVTMGQSSMFNGVNTLAALAEVGLEAGRDYVSNKLTIQSGRIDSLHNKLIPKFNDASFSYTGENTRFTNNKTQITVGHYVTLRAQVDFREGLSPTDVRLLFDLPEGCSLVEGSVMAGTQLVQYEKKGNRVIVPLSNIRDQVRFCVMPTRDGYYEPTASVSFNSGRTITQPLGSVAFTATALSIEVPEQSASGMVPVSGTAIANSTVQIYDDDVFIGQTQSGSAGNWQMQCMLNNPYNLSTHTVRAVITTPEGMQMETEASTVTIRHGTLSPVVKMTFSSEGHPSHLTWDFRTNMASASSYWARYASNTLPMEFDISFMNGDEVANDTLQISNVKLYVLMEDRTYMTFYPRFNETKGCWHAAYYYIESSIMPINVCVQFTQNETTVADRQQIDDQMDETEQSLAEMQQRAKNIYALPEKKMVLEDQAVYDELKQLLAKENPDEETSARINALLNSLVGTGNATKQVNTAELQKQLEDIIADKVEWRDNILSVLSVASITDTTALKKPDGDLSFDIDGYHYSAKKLGSVNTEELLAKGYKEMPMTDGKSIYYLTTDSIANYVDTRNNMQYTMELKKTEATARAANRKNIPALKITSIFDQELKKEFIDMFLDSTYGRGRVGVWYASFRDLYMSWGKYDQSYLSKNILTDEVNLLADMMTLSDKLLQSGLTNIHDQVDDYCKRYNENYDAMYECITEVIKEFEENVRDCRQRGGDVKTAVELLEWAQQERVSMVEFRKEMNQAKHTIDDIVRQVPKNLYNTRRNGLLMRKGRELAGTPIGIVLQLYHLYYQAYDVKWTISKWKSTQQYWESKYPCEDAQSEYEQIGEDMVKDAIHHGHQGMESCDFEGTRIAMADFVPHYDGVTPQWYVTQVIKQTWDGSFNFDINACDQARQAINMRIASLICNRPPEEGQKYAASDKFKKKEDPDKPEPEPLPYYVTKMDVKPVRDPSGFVYEGVSSNRLEGVKVTCFYKEEAEDMYGDLYEKVVVWDAENYEQENPLWTDPEGKYAWDVPQGMWQVKYEKAGYETTYSEWLPVPPPQLEVNVGMTQLRQPQVSHAAAYKNAVEVEFDKFMLPDSLNKYNISVTKDGQTLKGRIILLNADAGYQQPDKKYASRVAFLPTAPLAFNEQVLLTVRRCVESYAGLQMEEDFQQAFTVSNDTLAIDPSLLLVDSTLLKVATPKASRISGTEVPRGTTVELTSETEGATIWYTLDGTCPCDENGTRQQYTGPIAINGHTIIKAFAVMGVMQESEVASFEYFVIATPASITTSDAGWCTFYDSQENYQLADGLQAYCINLDASQGILNYVRLTDNIVPKAVAVAISSQSTGQGTYTLTPVDDATPYTGENLLYGSDVATTTTAPGDCYYYKAAYGPKGTALEKWFGWYPANANKGPFRSEAHRAWLAIPKSSSTRGYYGFGNDPTGIESVATESQPTEQYYDLQGRRIDKPQSPGVYISNRKKVIMK